MITCIFENKGKASLRHVVIDVIVIKNESVLLIKRALKLTNGGKWALPGGFVDRDESIKQAAIRELKEETGLIAKKVKMNKIIDDPNRKNEDRQNIVFVFEAKVAGKIKIQPEEVIEVKWFNVSKLPIESDFAFDHFEILTDFLKK